MQCTIGMMSRKFGLYRKDYTTMAETARKFKVEVIAEADGFKDYAEVDLKMNPHHLESITPNPQVTISISLIT